MWGSLNKNTGARLAVEPHHLQVPGLELEKVIGLLPKGANPIAYGPRGVVAYTASKVVVIYDPQTNVQVRFLTSRDRCHAIGCVAFSRDGGVLAGGEAGQHPSPAVLVWNMKEGELVSGRELRGHKYGVAGVAFSPDGEFIASVGASWDGQVIIWDWRQGVALCRQRAQADLSSVAFSPDSKKVLTTGKEHFKLWVLSCEASRQRTSSKAGMVLLPKPAMSGPLRNLAFVDVKSTVGRGNGGAGGIYALTRNGMLCMMRGTSRVIEKQINLNVTAAYGLAVSESKLACACSNGVVKLHTLKSLILVATLPEPSAVGRSQSGSDAVGDCLKIPRLSPDAFACAFENSGDSLVVVYDNRVVMFWDVRDKNKIQCFRTLDGHGGPIHDIVSMPEYPSCIRSTVPSGPPMSFATCSSDGSIRFWSLSNKLSQSNRYTQQQPQENITVDGSASGPGGLAVEERLGRRGLNFDWQLDMKVVQADSDSLERLVPMLSSRNKQSSEALLKAASSKKFQQLTNAVNAPSLRCMKISPDGEYMAVGDDEGVLRVYELADMQLVTKKNVHNGQLERLDFSNPTLDDDRMLLATGGGDGAVHVYDLENFETQSIEKYEEHGKEISGLCFADGGNKLVSCGRDKYVYFRRFAEEGPDGGSTNFHHQYLPRVFLYDMVINDSRSVAMTACSDRKIRCWCLDTGTLLHTIETSKRADHPVRVTQGPTATTMVCCHDNATTGVYEYFTGELLANCVGHSEYLTGATVTGAGSHLVTVGADGCIFVWRIDPEVVQRSHALASEKKMARQETGLTTAVCKELCADGGRDRDVLVRLQSDGMPRPKHPAVSRLERYLSDAIDNRLDTPTRQLACQMRASVPRLNLSGIGGGPPGADPVLKERYQAMTPLEFALAASDTTIASPDKPPNHHIAGDVERKDSDGSKENHLGVHVEATPPPLCKKLTRKGGFLNDKDNVLKSKLDPGEIYRKFSTQAYSRLRALEQKESDTGNEEQIMEVLQMNRPRVLAWVRDHAQHAVPAPTRIDRKGALGNLGKFGKGVVPFGKEQVRDRPQARVGMYNWKEYKAGRGPASKAPAPQREPAPKKITQTPTPVAEKKPRTKWCIPELPKSPRMSWSNSEGEKSNGKQPWSDDEEDERVAGKMQCSVDMLRTQSTESEMDVVEARKPWLHHRPLGSDDSFAKINMRLNKMLNKGKKSGQDLGGRKEDKSEKLEALAKKHERAEASQMRKDVMRKCHAVPHIPQQDTQIDDAPGRDTSFEGPVRRVKIPSRVKSTPTRKEVVAKLAGTKVPAARKAIPGPPKPVRYIEPHKMFKTADSETNLKPRVTPEWASSLHRRDSSESKIPSVITTGSSVTKSVNGDEPKSNTEGARYPDLGTTYSNPIYDSESAPSNAENAETARSAGKAAAVQTPNVMKQMIQVPPSSSFNHSTGRTRLRQTPLRLSMPRRRFVDLLDDLEEEDQDRVDVASEASSTGLSDYLHIMESDDLDDEKVAATKKLLKTDSTVDDKVMHSPVHITVSKKTDASKERKKRQSQVSMGGMDPPEVPLALGEDELCGTEEVEGVEKLPTDRDIPTRPLSAPLPCIGKLCNQLEGGDYLPAVKWCSNESKAERVTYPAEIIGTVSSSGNGESEPPHSQDFGAMSSRELMLVTERQLSSCLYDDEEDGVVKAKAGICSEKFEGACGGEAELAGLGGDLKCGKVDQGCVVSGKDGDDLVGGMDCIGEFAKAYEKLIVAAGDLGRILEKSGAADGVEMTRVKSAIMTELTKNLFGDAHAKDGVVGEFSKKSEVVSQTDISGGAAKEKGRAGKEAEEFAHLAEGVMRRFRCHLDNAMDHMMCDLQNMRLKS